MSAKRISPNELSHIIYEGGQDVLPELIEAKAAFHKLHWVYLSQIIQAHGEEILPALEKAGVLYEEILASILELNLDHHIIRILDKMHLASLQEYELTQIISKKGDEIIPILEAGGANKYGALLAALASMEHPLFIQIFEKTDFTKVNGYNLGIIIQNVNADIIARIKHLNANLKDIPISLIMTMDDAVVDSVIDYIPFTLQKNYVCPLNHLNIKGYHLYQDNNKPFHTDGKNNYIIKKIYGEKETALAEFLGSIIARSILGDFAPENLFIINEEENEVSIASKVIPGLSSSNLADLAYPNIEKVLLLSYLIAHGDYNNGNVVYIDINGNRHVSLIDYDMAFNQRLFACTGIEIKVGDLNYTVFQQAADEIGKLDIPQIIQYAYAESIKYFDQKTCDIFYSKAYDILIEHQGDIALHADLLTEIPKDSMVKYLIHSPELTDELIYCN